MDAQWLLTLLPLLLSISISYCKPEKLRINPDDVAKAMEFSNLTHRDKTEKVMFAWKVTMKTTQTTTTDPRHTSTLTEELHKKNNEIYDKLFAQLAYTLRDKVYLDRWLAEMDKGYHIFLYEIQKRDKYYFVKRFDNDQTFEGEEGKEMWEFMHSYLKYIGSKERFMSFITEGLNLTDERPPDENSNAFKEQLPKGEKTFIMIYEQLIPSFKNPKYRYRWMQSRDKGQGQFVKDLVQLGPKYFIYSNKTDDTTFQGAHGGLFWNCFVQMFKTLTAEGFMTLVDKIDKVPDNYTLEDLLVDRSLLATTERSTVGNTTGVLGGPPLILQDTSGVQK